MSANGTCRIACAVAVALGLGACDRSVSDQSSSATPPKAAAAKHAIARQVPTARASVTPMTQPAESDWVSPPWLAELLSSPDFQVRLQGLEAWAQHPGTTLDAVTYALVDPEESVRARAQEVFEEELARR